MGAPYPAGPRIVAGAGALLAGAYFGVLLPLSHLEQGYPATAAADVAATAPLALFLALLALAPEALQRVLSRFTRLDLRDGGHVAAALVMAGTLFWVLGLGALVAGVHAYELVREGRGDEALGGLGPEELTWALASNLVVLVLPVLLYVSFVHGHGPAGALRDLGLRAEGAGTAILVGFGLALLFVLGLGVVSLALERAGLGLPENERALAIARSVTLPGALAIAVVSALSEEVFFRGFLQPRVGLLAQAVVFSLAHLNYVSALELAVTFGLGLAFGLAFRRTGSLWAPIAAHFLFNLLMLLAGIYGDDLFPSGNETGNQTATPSP